MELGYDRMGRTDYNAEMVAGFRKQVHEHIVPVAGKLKQRQRERLQLDGLKFYDEGIKFNSGNATPKGDPDWIVANGAKMYQEMSPETGEFFSFMQENGLMDLVSKKARNSVATAPSSATTVLRLFSPTSMEPPAISTC